MSKGLLLTASRCKMRAAFFVVCGRSARSVHVWHSRVVSLAKRHHLPAPPRQSQRRNPPMPLGQRRPKANLGPLLMRARRVCLCSVSRTWERCGSEGAVSQSPRTQAKRRSLLSVTRSAWRCVMPRLWGGKVRWCFACQLRRAWCGRSDHAARSMAFLALEWRSSPMSRTRWSADCLRRWKRCGLLLRWKRTRRPASLPVLARARRSRI
mmetsp:Transcript_5771/g.18340  ORF Transcript_5771/g.18340 Transcript_5771/m.18340 type:complete len:209 (-) Transcript_5771:984-1610(-)